MASIHLSGNDPDATPANAKAGGGDNKGKGEDGDMRQMPFPDASFDTVVSSLAIHNISGASERAKAVGEIVRVLKPGGRVAIFDIFQPRAYAKELQRLGMA